MTTTDNDVKVIQQQQQKKWIKFWDDDDKCTSYKIQTFFPFIYTFLFYIPFASQTTLWRWWLCWWYRIVNIYIQQCGIFMHDKLINFVDQKKNDLKQKRRHETVIYFFVPDGPNNDKKQATKPVLLFL